MRNANIQHAKFEKCNIYRLDFFHAVTNKTVMKDCLKTTPQPINFEGQFIHG